MYKRKSLLLLLAKNKVFSKSEGMDRENIRIKKELISCMEDLIDKIEFCASLGMRDTPSLYNAVLDMEKTVSYAKIAADLENVLYKGQALEKNLDSWLLRHGKETTALFWPKI